MITNLFRLEKDKDINDKALKSIRSLYGLKRWKSINDKVLLNDKESCMNQMKKIIINQ